MEIITARPTGMSYKDFKYHLQKQKRAIKYRIKFGRMMWLSALPFKPDRAKLFGVPNGTYRKGCAGDPWKKV